MTAGQFLIFLPFFYIQHTSSFTFRLCKNTFSERGLKGMGNLASRLAVQVTLASTNSYLEQIKNNIVSFLDDVAPYVYVIVAVSLAAIGLVFIFGSDRAKQLAKEKIPYIIVGTLLCLGPTIIAQAITNALSFG